MSGTVFRSLLCLISDATLTVLKLLTHRPEDPPASKTEALVTSPEVPTISQPPSDLVNLYVLPPHSPWTNTPSTSTTSLDNIPRPLRQISNVVTFRSAKALSAHSVCRVLHNGPPVYRHKTKLDLTQTQAQMSTHYGSDHGYLFLYSTQLVPEYWSSLCELPGSCISFTSKLAEVLIHSPLIIMSTYRY